MVNEISISEGLFGRTSDAAISVARKNKQLQYWKKCLGQLLTGGYCPIHTQELGWVTTGPVMSTLTAVEYTEFQNSKHMTPLSKYGAYEVGHVEGVKYTLTDARTRFLAIIDQNGILEFPIDQMIAYNWHRIEPVRRAIPELRDVVDIHCEYGGNCINRFFTSRDDYITHVGIMHKEAAAPKAIGEELGKAVSQLTMQGVGSFSPDQIAQIVAATVAAMKSMETSSVPKTELE